MNPLRKKTLVSKLSFQIQDSDSDQVLNRLACPDIEKDKTFGEASYAEVQGETSLRFS